VPTLEMVLTSRDTTLQRSYALESQSHLLTGTNEANGSEWHLPEILLSWRRRPQHCIAYATFGAVQSLSCRRACTQGILAPVQRDMHMHKLAQGKLAALALM